ncbi:MAG: class I SAM-dependent methyltransferase [Polyangiales bacterium]
MSWDAKGYHVVSGPQLGWGIKVLERLELRGDEVVMDAGCGTGRVTELLLEKLPRGRVIALDVDAAMLAQAREHLAKYGDRVEYVQASLLDLPPMQVDLVFSTATFHWVTDHDALFRSLFGALKPGGRLFAQCGGGTNLQKPIARMTKIIREPRFAPYFADAKETWFYGGEEDSVMRMKRAGFVDAHAKLEPAPTPFPDRAAFRAFADRVVLGQRLQRLPPELRAEVVDRVTDEFAHDDPPFVLDYVRLNLSALRP